MLLVRLFFDICLFVAMLKTDDDMMIDRMVYAIYQVMCNV